MNGEEERRLRCWLVEIKKLELLPSLDANAKYAYAWAYANFALMTGRWPKEVLEFCE